MSVSVGDKLGPYEILASIGSDGMGEVWKARDARSGGSWHAFLWHGITGETAPAGGLH